jgi:hypothetical protein
MIDIASLEKAIAQLETSLKYSESDLAKKDEGIAKQFRAAAIQAFEFTYEVSHKMLIPKFLEEAKYLRDQINGRQRQR